jgi:hypothetical protein
MSSVSASLLQHKETDETNIKAKTIWTTGVIRNLADAIIHTLVYADVFDYPLKSEEIHRYLTGYPAPLAAVEEQLQQNGRLSKQIRSVSPFWFLAGREQLVDLRQKRDAFSRVLWQQATRYGYLIAALPFVRMVSITGSLAMNNVSSPRDDIDLLIVMAKDRVWLARGLVILIVHLARRFGVELCPNYVIAEHRLELEAHDLFTAHELAQLFPLCGLDMYQRLLKSNAWMIDFLPNASSRQVSARETGMAVRMGQQGLEAVLSGRLGDTIERWERERKIPRLRQVAHERGGKRASYTPDLCKGHPDDHTDSVYQQYVARLIAQGI